MDFATRDRYRHAVEEVAKRSRFSEGEVARKAVTLAEAAHKDDPDDRTAHVGYYLVDKGQPALESVAAMHPTLGAAAARLGHRYPLFFYLGGVAVITAAVAAAALAWAARHGAHPWALAALAVPMVLCTCHLAIGLANWVTTTFVKPRALPRMDYRLGIPPDKRTMVAVPTMLSSPRAIGDLLEALEVRYLANRGPNLHFALLTDFRDAPQEHMPEDENLVKLAREGIEELNEKYKEDRGGIFYLF